MRVLVLNPGSSSLKASLVEQPGDRTLARRERDWHAEVAGEAEREAVLRSLLRELDIKGAAVDAVGYRVVHGGSQLVAPTPIDDAVVAAIRELDALAPLHNTIAADTIDAGRSVLPGVAHVACFDTAFHAGLPEAARRYPLPEAWHVEWGIRRYGFHGLSVAWSVERAAELLGRPVGQLQLVVAHLGSGSSVTAVAGGRSVDTSMGMTPLEGLMMGTRSGSIDPGVLLDVLMRRSSTVEELADAIAHRSGLLGVSGRSASVRELESTADSGDERATLALEMYARRAAAGIAAVASALDRLEAVVFTAGIGEHSHWMRAAICRRLAVMGVPMPAEAADDSDQMLATGATIAVLRVAAREDLVVAREVARILNAG